MYHSSPSVPLHLVPPLKCNPAALQSLGHIIRSKPHILIVSLIVLGLMLGLGIWAVEQGAQSSADAARWDACSPVAEFPTQVERQHT